MGGVTGPLPPRQPGLGVIVPRASGGCEASVLCVSLASSFFSYDEHILDFQCLCFWHWGLNPGPPSCFPESPRLAWNLPSSALASQ